MSDENRRSFTDVFIRHPVLAVVVNLIIVLMGWRALTTLPVQQYPQIESSSVVITTVYYGASAETVRGFLTTPIERSVSAISGVDYIESSSRAGISTVTVRLKLDHSSTAALAEVTARLQQVRAELPSEAEPPIVEVQRADRPYASFYLSFSSSTRDTPAVTDWLARTLQPQFSTLAGVQRVSFEGARQLAMRVWIDPDRLAALNLSPGDVQAALRRNNFLAAVGQTKGDLVQLNLLANTDLRSAAEFNDLIVADRGGAIVRLRDVARVELGAEEAGMVAKYSDREAVYLGVWPLIGTNEIEVAHRLRAEMERIRPTLPADIQMELAYDATMFMEDALEEITKTLTETILIVGIVVFLFMGSLRTALVPLVAMPVSLVGAAIVMYLLGFSLNLLTILAIVLSVGLVVDDAIVVVENIARHVRLGRTPTEAALIGARELVGPIIAMTITLAAVYAPIGFQSGLTGSLFLEFAITLAVTVVLSGVVAVTLSPMMSAHAVRAHGHEGRLTRIVDGAFDKVRDVYARLFDAALGIRWAVVVGALLVMAAAWPLYTFSKRELAPVEDQSHISLFMQASPDASLAATDRASREVVKAVQGFPETRFMWSLTANWGAFGGMVATDWKTRDRSTAEMYGQVYGAVSQIPGVRVFPRLDPPLPTPGQYDVELVLQGDLPPERMLEVVGGVVGAGWQSGKFLYVDTDLKIDLPEARVVIDRERVADLGLDLASVGRELGTLLGGAYVNRFNYFDRSYKVIPQIGDEGRATVDPLLDLKIKTPTGQLVPVSSFTRIESSTAPRTLDRFQQRNAVRVFGGVNPGVTKEEGLRVLEEAALATTAGTGIVLDHAGESRQIRREGSALTATLGFALVLIYLVLAAQFQSFRDPLIVLLGSVPLAITGALIFSFLGLTTINIYSQVGLITLVGLIAKNGILIVQFANRLRVDGMAKMEALREASLTRLRPVLMTSVATVLGHAPLVFVTGPGSEARNSIGIVLVAGMIIGTIFTLFVVPVFYSFIAAEPRAVAADAPAEGFSLGGLAPVAAQARHVALVPLLLVLGGAMAPLVAQPSAAPQGAGEVVAAWRSIGDSTLTRLVDDAMSGNQDLQGALARVRGARAARFGAALDLAPAVRVSGGYTRQRLASSTVPGASGTLPDQELWDAGLTLAWEVDLFGRTRGNVRGQGAFVRAGTEEVRGVSVLVAAEVADAYFTLRGAQDRLAVATRNAENQRRSLDLTRTRLEGGRGTGLDVERAQAQLSATMAEMPTLEAAIVAAQERLAVLTGRAPTGLAPAAVAPTVVFPAVPSPEDLTRVIAQRPDVRRAAHEAAARAAFVGAARAGYLPRLTVGGGAGYTGTTIGSLGDTGTPRFAVASVVSWAAFDLGRVKVEVDGARAVSAEADARATQTTRVARAEATAAITAYQRAQERLRHLDEAAAASERAADLARLRYTEGASDFLPVLDAERTLLDAQDRRAVGRLDAARALVDAYRALGGAWPVGSSGTR